MVASDQSNALPLPIALFHAHWQLLSAISTRQATSGPEELRHACKLAPPASCRPSNCLFHPRLASLKVNHPHLLLPPFVPRSSHILNLQSHSSPQLSDRPSPQPHLVPSAHLSLYRSKYTPSDDLASGSLVPLFTPSCSSILCTSIATRGTQPAIHVYTVLSIFAPLSCMNPPIAPLAPLSSHIHDVVFEQRVRRYNASVFAHWEARLIASLAGRIRSCGPFTQRLKCRDSIPYFSLQHTSSRPPKRSAIHSTKCVPLDKYQHSICLHSGVLTSDLQECREMHVFSYPVSPCEHHSPNLLFSSSTVSRGQALVDMHDKTFKNDYLLHVFPKMRTSVVSPAHTHRINCDF